MLSMLGHWEHFLLLIVVMAKSLKKKVIAT